MAKSGPSIPIGTRVTFTLDNLGASLRDELWSTTGETYGSGDIGLVAFRHPNKVKCRDWVYVEVDSKAVPGEKRYVGVTPIMVSSLIDQPKLELLPPRVVAMSAAEAKAFADGVFNGEPIDIGPADAEKYKPGARIYEFR